MTCCILAGFAKKKKYVGTIYACDGSDLPTTQDFGTVQYQGPFESAQTVPATTVTYTIVGKTQCGDDIRRITTKTYSSRSVVNQHKALHGGGGFTNSEAWTGISSANWPSIFASTIGYGATFIDAYLNFELKIYNMCNDAFKDALTPGTFSVYYQTILRLSYAGGFSDTALTLYYLDVHEVWTYDLV